MILQSERLTLREALASNRLEAFVRQEEARGVEFARGPSSNVRSRSSLRSVEPKVGRFSGCESPSVFPSDDGN